MNEKLRAGYRQLGESVPVYGDLDRAIRSARRRRLGQQVGTPVLAATLVAAIVLAVAHPWSSTPPVVPPAPSAQITDWVPATRQTGKPAEAGTLMYYSCTGDGCGMRLVAPDGGELELAELRPDLAERLAEYGTSGVSLSYDGQWLGIPADGAYTLYPMAAEPGRPGQPTEIQVPAGPPGSVWEVVGWGWTSAGLSLAQWQDDRVLAFAIVNTVGGHPVQVVDQPTGMNLLPVQHGGDGLLVADPLDTTIPPAQRTRVTQSTVRSLHVAADDGGYRPGHLTAPLNGRDSSECMQPTETLAGPAGVPVELEPPPSQAIGTMAESVGASLAFTTQGGTLVPSALLRGRACSGLEWMRLGRLGIPLSTPEVNWTFLGVLTDGEVAMARTPTFGGDMDVIEVGFSGLRTLHQDLPSDAQVLVPGSTLPWG